MENCFRNDELVIDYNGYTKRYTIKRAGSWISASPGAVRIWFSMMHEFDDEKYQKVTVSQGRSHLLITKLFGNFNFEFATGNIANVLSVPADTAKILLEYKDKILDKTARLDVRLKKLDKRFIQEAEQHISSENIRKKGSKQHISGENVRKNARKLKDTAKASKKMKKTSGAVEMCDTVEMCNATLGCSNLQFGDIRSEDILQV